MKRQTQYPALSNIRMLIALVVFCLSITTSTSAQTGNNGNDSGNDNSAKKMQTNEDPIFEPVYRKFYTSYRLGPGDMIAVRIQGQPEYSKDQLKVSPVGAIYLELLGDVAVAGMTLEQARDYLAKELSEYLKDPKVTVSLIEAVSAKVGVIGEVMRPGILVMARPMNLLDAITDAGGFSNTGSKSDVEVIRLLADGSRTPMRINVKRILEGKSKPEDNIMLQSGDVVYVHGNMVKKISTVTAFAGFGSFLSFMTIGRR
jgi:polysaccharide export outer membrane protein